MHIIISMRQSVSQSANQSIVYLTLAANGWNSKQQKHSCSTTVQVGLFKHTHAYNQASPEVRECI